MERKNMWKQYTDAQYLEVEQLSERYKECLNAGKTERECVVLGIEMAKKAGYRNLNECIKEDTHLKAGDKVYAECMGKALILFQMGTEPLENGMNILGAHVDSPRLDIKQNPLYEDSDMAFLDTHYYGGIKKYQWVTIPLALHGTVAKKDGSSVNVVIGENENDPVLVISDLLIHIAQEQMEKKANIVIEGEKLDVLVGTKPLTETEEDNDLVKASILKYLKDNYDMEEEDFLSAEFEIVPAGKARDCGLDRSMIIGYGQDDRVCAFTSIFAMLETENPKRTSCCILVDKEEIGSVGATGMHSRFFEDTVAEIAALSGGMEGLTVRRAIHNSYMLSSDVSSAYDPLYADAFEKKNTAFFGRGLVLNKYTGSRGKNNTNDASAEYIAKLRKVMDENEVGFQTAEMGRVDLGGSGTIAYIMANYGMNVIDSGVAVLSMHAPHEVTSKSDIYEVYRGYKAFLKDMK
ncbi:aminopeptidase [Faecalicatena contorta]|uniref:aminopeptidase n=1 Tax=Faecalicatena contorta TaxID=39482 RepID=UPI001F227EF2|nr:aminopeptidase [Faecalicatena contorta]MCF2684124.1 aminopeptidase [Faecalicatena contorta]